MRETGQEFKVGMFVIGGFALFIALLFNMDVFKLQSGRALKATFNYTYGLYVGAPVQLAGVPVGNVETIRIRRDDAVHTRVEVTSRIQSDVRVDQGSGARINMQGLLGQKYLEIIPPKEPAEPLGSGGVLLGEDPVGLEDLASSGGTVVKKLESSIDYLNSLMGDEEFRSKLKENVTGFSELIVSLKEVSASLDEILSRLERGEGTIGKLLTDETIYNDLRDLVKDIKANPWKLLKKDKKGFSLF